MAAFQLGSRKDGSAAATHGEDILSIEAKYTIKLKLLTDTSKVSMEYRIRRRIIDFICSVKDIPHLRYRALALLQCIEDCKRTVNDAESYESNNGS